MFKFLKIIAAVSVIALLAGCATVPVGSQLPTKSRVAVVSNLGNSGNLFQTGTIIHDGDKTVHLPIALDKSVSRSTANAVKRTGFTPIITRAPKSLNSSDSSLYNYIGQLEPKASQALRQVASKARANYVLLIDKATYNPGNYQYGIPGYGVYNHTLLGLGRAIKYGSFYASLFKVGSNVSRVGVAYGSFAKEDQSFHHNFGQLSNSQKRALGNFIQQQYSMLVGKKVFTLLSR